MIHYYWAYNLLIGSVLPLPELGVEVEPKSTEVDLVVRLGRVPATFGDPRGCGVLFQAVPGELLLHMNGVAGYHVRQGHEIIIEPEPGALDSDVRVFLLGSCFGAALHQRGLLVLHASGIGAPDTGAVLFAGPSGVGKSTLLGALLKRDHRMMVDDICALDVAADGQVKVRSASPRIQLWADSARQLEQSVYGLPRTRPNLPKYECQMEDQFHATSLPLRHLYVLTRRQSDNISFRTVRGVESMQAVLGQTYQREFLHGLGQRMENFAQAARVARHFPVIRVYRPDYPFLLNELTLAVEKHMAAEATAAEPRHG